MVSSSLASQVYVFDPRPHYPLRIALKRYWKASSPDAQDPDALTLIFTHGTGFHKEQWEPTIDDLYSLFNGNESVKIRDVFAIDMANHGDSAILNEKELLGERYNPICAWEEYARSIHACLAGLGTGLDVDFSKRRLVGIGHSMGAVSLIMSLNYQPAVKFESLIFVELMSMAEKYMGKPSAMLVGGAVNRRDIWASREEAYRLLKARPAWKVWDDRVLKIFVEEGLRPLPTVNYPDKTEGVTLKCSRIQETACYRDPVGSTTAYATLEYHAKRVPIHLIYGAIDDYLPRVVKDDVVENAAGGVQNLASLKRVEGAGHLAVQMNPRGVAQAIYEDLTQPSKTQTQAKL